MKVTVIEIKHYQLENISKICHKQSPEIWLQLAMGINFISSKDNDKDRLMHSKSDNIEMIINDKADEVIKDLNHFFIVIKLG